MAALLCRGEGEGINSAAGFRGSWGGDGSGYLGNALGGNKNKLEFCLQLYLVVFVLALIRLLCA